jgi:transmembrane sensor
MNIHKQPGSHLHAESESDISDLMPYINAAKDRFPSKEELFAEVNKDRDSRKKRVKAIQYTTALVFCALGIWTINPTISSNTYTTQYARNEHFSLPDGSDVQLNANSTLIAKYRLRSREMTLEKGEASFMVKHELRPFTVAVNASVVRDIGTVFNIFKWGQSFVTTVLEGEVELQTGTQKARVTAGQSIKVSNLDMGSPYAANMDMVTAWQTGKIIFNKTPLKEAMENIQRYRKGEIELDPRVEGILITGIYDINKLEPLLDSMSAMLPVKVTRLSDEKIKIQKN